VIKFEDRRERSESKVIHVVGLGIYMARGGAEIIEIHELVSGSGYSLRVSGIQVNLTAFCTFPNVWAC
jgi:hypothetical protein